MNSVPQPNWWSRNWKWVVPAGCLTGLMAFVGFVASIMFFVFGLMKSSDAYIQALQKARANPAVVQALGEPIADGSFTSGSVNETGPTGTAELQIPISGPKGKATLFVVAHKSVGRWTFSKLEVETEASPERIDLLEQSER